MISEMEEKDILKPSNDSDKNEGELLPSYLKLALKANKKITDPFKKTIEASYWDFKNAKGSRFITFSFMLFDNIYIEFANLFYDTVDRGEKEIKVRVFQLINNEKVTKKELNLPIEGKYLEYDICAIQGINIIYLSEQQFIISYEPVSASYNEWNKTWTYYTSDSSTISIWNIENGKELSNWACKAKLNFLVALPNKRIAGISQNGFEIWNSQGKTLRKFPNSSLIKFIVEYSANCFATISEDNNLKIWSSETSEYKGISCAITEKKNEKDNEKKNKNIKGNDISALIEVSKQLLATAGKDGIVRLWEHDISKPAKKLYGHSGPIIKLTMLTKGRLASLSSSTSLEEDSSEEDSLLVEGTLSFTLKIWDVATEKCIQTIQNVEFFNSFNNQANTSCYLLELPNDEILTKNGNNFCIWSMKTQECLQIIPNEDFFSVNFIAQDNQLLCMSIQKEKLYFEILQLQNQVIEDKLLLTLLKTLQDQFPTLKKQLSEEISKKEDKVTNQIQQSMVQIQQQFSLELNKMAENTSAKENIAATKMEQSITQMQNQFNLGLKTILENYQLIRAQFTKQESLINELTQQNKSLSSEVTKQQDLIQDLGKKIQILSTKAILSNESGLKEDPSKLQANARGFFARKQFYEKFVRNMEAKIMQDLISNKKYSTLSIFSQAIEQENWTKAMEIIQKETQNENTLSDNNNLNKN